MPAEQCPRTSRECGEWPQRGRCGGFYTHMADAMYIHYIRILIHMTKKSGAAANSEVTDMHHVHGAGTT